MDEKINIKNEMKSGNLLLALPVYVGLHNLYIIWSLYPVYIIWFFIIYPTKNISSVILRLNFRDFSSVYSFGGNRYTHYKSLNSIAIF